MQYFIHYKPVFSCNGKVFRGYEILANEESLCGAMTDYETIPVKSSSDKEFNRLCQMLSYYSSIDGVSFTTHHPLEIIYYLRGKKFPKQRDDSWKQRLSVKR